MVVIFEQKLLSVGYNPAISYENLISVRENAIMYYKVTEDFPCITVAEIPECISDVKYNLELYGISEFAVAEIIERRK